MADTDRPLVIILGFHQTYERLPVKGEILDDDVDAQGFKVDEKGKRILENVEVDWVTYAPAHSPMGANTTERIRHLRPTQEIMDGENAEKTRFMMARWSAIEGPYEAWKAGHALPVHGTPLSAWPGVSASMAEELKRYHVRTVEDVAALGENQLEKIRLPDMRGLRTSAKAFLDNMGAAQSAEREAARDNEIAALREQLEAAMQLLEEKAGGGADDIADLKAQLDAKGIKYHHKAGASTLKALLAEAA